MLSLLPGLTFTHDRVLEPSWRPSEGQKYVDAPKAAMRVFRVTRDTVWYGYADAQRSSFRLPREEFINRFLETVDTALPDPPY